MSTVCIARKPSRMGSASCGWYSRPSPVLVTAREKCVSCLRTTYTIGARRLSCTNRRAGAENAPSACFARAPQPHRSNPENAGYRAIPRGTPRRDPQPHERLSRVRERRRLLGRRRNRQLSQRATHVRGGFDQRAKRPDGVTGGQRHAASFHSLFREHGVRHEVYERGVSHTAPGRFRMAGPPSGPTRPARSSARQEAFAALGLSGGVRGGVRAFVSGGGAGDAASGAARCGVSRLRDGFGEGGDPRVHGGRAVRLEDKGAARGVLIPGLGLEHEDALAGELIRQAELGEARLGVEDAHAGVGADGRLSPGLVLARGTVAREVTERRHLRTGRGVGEREEAPIPLLAAAEGVGAALLGEPSGDDHLLARGRRRHCCFRGSDRQAGTLNSPLGGPAAGRNARVPDRPLARGSAGSRA